MTARKFGLLLLVAFPLAGTAQTPPSWHLRLVRAIRPAEGSSGMLGEVSGIAIREDGAVFVAEPTPGRVAEYDKVGAFVRVVMRTGDGPGETRHPQVTMQADTLVVFDAYQGRLSRIAPSGRLLSEQRVDVPPDRRISAADDGHILLDAGPAHGGSDGNAVRVAPNGQLDTIRWLHPRSEDLSFIWEGPGWDIVGRPPFSPVGVTAFDRSGRVVIGGSRRSRWVVLAGRDTVQSVTLPDHVVPIDKRVRDSVWSVYFAKLIPRRATMPHLDDVVREDRIPTTLPPWVSFDIDANGNWWVGRPGPTGVLASWDVVRNGRLVGNVPVPQAVTDVFPSGPITAFGKDLIALLHEDGDGAPWIGVYRVVR